MHVAEAVMAGRYSTNKRARDVCCGDSGDRRGMCGCKAQHMGMPCTLWSCSGKWLGSPACMMRACGQGTEGTSGTAYASRAVSKGAAPWTSGLWISYTWMAVDFLKATMQMLEDVWHGKSGDSAEETQVAVDLSTGWCSSLSKSAAQSHGVMRWLQSLRRHLQDCVHA